MKVIIPAAGIGKRLRPYTLRLPKSLLFVAGDTIIGHILSVLENSEVEEIRIVVSPASPIPSFLKGKYPDKNISFRVQENPLGLGHAVFQGLDEADSGSVLIMLGDTIIPFNLQSVLESLEDGVGFLAAREVEDPRRFGVIELEGNYVSKLVEKPENPKSRLAICGVYYLPSAKRLREAILELINKDIRTRGEYQLTDALSILLSRGEKLITFGVDNWMDCGTPQALIDANHTLLASSSRIVPVSDSLIKPPCWIGENVTIQNSIIGPYVSIASGAEIRNSVISNTIINQNAVVEAMVLTQTIVGYEARLCRSVLSLNLGPFSSLESL